MAGSIIPYKSYILKTAHSIVLGNGELYEVGRSFFKLSTYCARQKNPELKWKKKLLPWRIAVQTFTGKLFLFKSLFLVLILKRLSIIEEPLI